MLILFSLVLEEFWQARQEKMRSDISVGYFMVMRSVHKEGWKFFSVEKKNSFTRKTSVANFIHDAGPDLQPGREVLGKHLLQILARSQRVSSISHCDIMASN